MRAKERGFDVELAWIGRRVALLDGWRVLEPRLGGGWES